jgi:hypothetical protein
MPLLRRAQQRPSTDTDKRDRVDRLDPSTRRRIRIQRDATSTTPHAHAATTPNQIDAGPARSRRPSRSVSTPAASMTARMPSHSHSGGAAKRRSSPSSRAGCPSTTNGTLHSPRLAPGGRPWNRASGQITECRPRSSSHRGVEDEPCSAFLTSRRAAAVGDRGVHPQPPGAKTKHGFAEISEQHHAMTGSDRDAESAVAPEDLSRVRIRLRINHACPVINCHRAGAGARQPAPRLERSEDGRDDARQQDPTRHCASFCTLGPIAHEPGGNGYAE